MHNNFKKIAFGDNLKMRFSVVRKVFYTFLHHKVFIFFIILCLLPLKLPAADPPPFEDSQITISMDFQDANLKDVVKIFSIQSGLNFIASEAVQERRITLFLDKVPVKEAMDKLFKANNLTYELDQEAKIFIVKDWGKPEIETITKVYYLKYRSVPSARLETEKTNLLQTGAATTAQTGAATTADIITSIKQTLSSAGKITEDTRTNSLIITDVPSRFSVIEQVIAKLDVPQLQVMLEVEMLDVSKDTVDKMGFEFGNNPFSLLIGRAGGAGNKIRGFIGDVTLKAPQAFTSAATGVVAIGGTYTETLDFLRTQTDTKYLARPRLLTLNNETAEIAITKDEVVGKKETSTTVTSGTTTTVEYIRSTDLTLTGEGTGIFLRVTPQINPDTNEITMVINPKSSVTSTSTLFTTQADAEVRSTKSIVKVKNGETVVLGGLIHRDRRLVIKKLPILGDIPFLGALFRHKNQTKDIERELLVFITPHIVKDTNVEFAQAKKTSLLTKEQITALPSDRQSAIDASLNSFEKVK